MNKLIVFDLDGTLCYTIEDMVIAVNYGLTENGYPALGKDRIMKTVGYSTEYMIRKALPSGATEEEFNKVMSGFVRHYASHFCDHVRIYRGATEALCRLKERGFELACVSNKPNPLCRGMIRKFFPEYLFSFVLGMLPTVTIKPDAAPLNFTFDYLNATKEGSYYVGDSEVDIQFAKNAGIPCISCVWGYRSEKYLKKAGATTIIKGFDELDDVIL